jgi:hypothetical protein
LRRFSSGQERFALVLMGAAEWAALHDLTTVRLATIGGGVQIEKRMRIHYWSLGY